MFSNIMKMSMGNTTPDVSYVSADRAINSDVDSDPMSGETPTAKKTEIMLDEQANTRTLEVSSNLRPEGFSKKSFDFKEILQRQVIINTVGTEWSNTDIVGSVLSREDFPQALLSVPFMRAKLRSFAAIKTEIEVEVKINPTPFLMGALAVVLHPSDHTPSSIESWTYYPHEVINLPSINNALVQVPFLNEEEAYDIGGFSPWTISLVVLSPLSGPTTNSKLDIFMFARLCEPEVMLPQFPVAQSGDNEMSAQETGLITKVSGAVADTLEGAGTVLSAIPEVGMFIPPLTWAARAVHKVSSYFGWAKPVNMEIAALMTPGVAWRMCQGEGVDNSVALAISPDNSVNSNQSYTGVDEMDYSYIMERKFVVNTFRMNVGDYFGTYDLTLKNNSTSTNVITMHHRKRYMINLEFHFVKTAFHTGRVLIQYDHSSSIKASEDTKEAIPSVYSKVVDLSKQDRFVFTVPWMSTQPFSDDIRGELKISSFTPILATDTVAQYVDVFVYTSYRDVQLGQPSMGDAWVNPRTNPRFRKNSRIRAQGECCGNGAAIPTDSLIPYQADSMFESCLGEKICSLRTLIKRFSPCGDLVVDRSLVFGSSDLIEGSLFHWINMMYYARSGGIRYKLVIPYEAVIQVELLGSTARDVSANAVHVFSGRSNVVVEIQIPYYGRTRRSFDHYPWAQLRITQLNYSGPINVQVYVAAGDDYNGMFLRGMQVVDKVSSKYLFSGIYEPELAVKAIMGPWVNIVASTTSTGVARDFLTSSFPGLNNPEAAYASLIYQDTLFAYRENDGFWYACKKGLVGPTSGKVVVPTEEDIIFSFRNNLHAMNPANILVSKREDMFQRWGLDYSLVDWSEEQVIYNSCSAAYFSGESFEFTLLDISVKNAPLLFTSGFGGGDDWGDVPYIIGRSKDGTWMGWYLNREEASIIIMNDVVDGVYETSLPGGPYIGPYKGGRRLLN